ncbi:MAG: PilZ domain-containing protein [Fimbriimonadaceae bacterium]|nr:MAG: PilZ domain-containing protein [Fimbriimonadaceae bacterium]
MALTSQESFVGTRARFQRFRDGKFFYGWVEQFSGNYLRVTTQNHYPVVVNDEFRFECCGRDSSAVFKAALSDVWLPTANLVETKDAIQGSTALKISAVNRSTFELKVDGLIEYVANSEVVRMKLPEIPTTVTVRGQQVEGYAIDISTGGIGVISPMPIPTSSEVHVVIDSKVSEILVSGDVVYCRPDQLLNGMHRCGIKFSDLSRSTLAQINRLIQVSGF